MLSESLGGKIKVDSREGEWTKFTFYIEDLKLHDEKPESERTEKCNYNDTEEGEMTVPIDESFDLKSKISLYFN